MLGAIAGDVIGSVYEGAPLKSTDFPLFVDSSRFTDDTVLTVAVAKWLLDGGDLVDVLHESVARYPAAGYGGTFIHWALQRQREPYHSWGNGSAMRVSPVGFACGTWQETLDRAKQSAAVTHDHPEGIQGAQATAAAVFLARQGESRESIRGTLEATFDYDLGRSLEEIRPAYAFDVSCQGSVPESLIAFLESHDWESAVRNAVSLGGDADTMACIAGAVSEAFYGGVPADVRAETLGRLDGALIDVVERFEGRFGG